MDEGTLNLEILIQVTLIPKGEQRPSKAALKRVYVDTLIDTVAERMVHTPDFLIYVLVCTAQSTESMKTNDIPLKSPIELQQ